MFLTKKLFCAACGDDGGHSAIGACCKGMLCKKRLTILVGALSSAIFIAGAFAICYIIKHSVDRNAHHPRPACLPKVLGKSCRTRLFTYQELKDATNGFDEEQQITSLVDGTTHMGIIDDGSLVAVEKLNCVGDQHLRQVWESIEILTQVSHKNIAGIIGCCIGSNHSLFLVHEFFPHGTLEDHLDRRRGSGLGWHHRVNIATEVASALSFLQSEISPPINLSNLKSSEIFIGADYSVKIASVKFLNSGIEVGSCSYGVSQDSQVAYNFGLILLELITGSRKEHLLELTLFKIKDRMFHEIVDPYLNFAEQPTFQCEQIERIAIFAAQCVAKNARESTSMVGVAKDFVSIANAVMESSGKTQNVKLEVTFSNSSLLQMISMSPDSILVS
ncbi:receptor-like protein kinase [Platanthera zijinensis]|uniref:Receptor-like protein kinase n=1 Tax=Platanthera zijinensis TaxID=2320716 RepID=A0AAP0GFR5_9ASPA